MPDAADRMSDETPEQEQPVMAKTADAPEVVTVEIKASFVTDGPKGSIVVMERSRAEGLAESGLVEIIPEA